ncbi:MAG TPA: enoyl-CoA hydratase/isomerase family protein [Alphaproteobacteria bacterium]|jgi:enoyl-CoA hydratase/carnithine racemase|nr:enoyl-CoA hydratase/isomerase family protein [Alphaproteobacteria bacterium]
MAATSDYETLIVERRDAADWLTLNRPARLNAFNATMIAELDDYFGRLMADHAVRVVVMRGAGRAFCAGVDVKEIDSLVANGIAPDMAGQRRISEVIVKMRRCPQPIVALLHGAATGGGFALALAADIRLAGMSARMNCAFIKLGLTSCDMGLSYALPRLIGPANAAALMYTGRFVDAARAEAMGLVCEAMADEALDTAAEGYVAEMLATAPLGLRLTKDGLNQALAATGLEAAIAVEDRNQVLTLNGPDFAEGLAAFREKRAPVWTS